MTTTWTVPNASITFTATADAEKMAAIPRDHLAEARAQEKGLNAGRRRFKDVVRGVGLTFGASVEHALTVQLDDVLEQHSLIVVSYEDAVDAAVRKITSAQRHLEVEEAVYGEKIDALWQLINTQKRLIGEIVADTAKRRYRTLPDWFEAAREYSAADEGGDR